MLNRCLILLAAFLIGTLLIAESLLFGRHKRN